MKDAVIVSAIRTPVGRAYKGMLKDTRPDDLAALVINEALKTVPGLDAYLDGQKNRSAQP